MSRTLAIGGAVLLVLIALGAFGAWRYYAVHKSVAPQRTAYTASSTPFMALTQSNAAFTKGLELLKEKNYPGALAAFKEALPLATDPAQRAQIQFDIASTMSYTDPLSAVPLLKAIAADSVNIPIMRAYAVDYLGRLYYASLDPALTDAIFKDAPYAQMYVKGDAKLSYRHLFEYATSFYPMAEAELYVADWYALRINALAQSAPSSPEIAADYQEIKTRVALADTDIAIQLKDPAEVSLVPSELQRKALILARIVPAGLATPADAEAAFRTALSAYATYSTAPLDDYLRFFYALFLVQTYGKTRLADVETLLAPFYGDAAYANSNAVKLFKDPSRDATGTVRKWLIIVANADPKFKAYLLTLGWNAGAFK